MHRNSNGADKSQEHGVYGNGMAHYDQEPRAFASLTVYSESTQEANVIKELKIGAQIDEYKTRGIDPSPSSKLGYPALALRRNSVRDVMAYRY